jgi:hypothetical protein
MKDSIAGLNPSSSNGTVTYVQGPGNLQAGYFRNNFYTPSFSAPAATCNVYSPSFSINPSITGVTVCTWALINSECIYSPGGGYNQNGFLFTPYFTFQYLNTNYTYQLSAYASAADGGGLARTYPGASKYYTSLSDIINKWHHMACTYIEPVTYLYIDGYFVGSGFTPNQTMTVQSGICMGALSQGDRRFADAALADVRIYNYTLSASDIYSIYSRAGGPGINPQGTLTQSPQGTIGPNCTMRNSGGI